MQPRMPWYARVTLADGTRNEKVFDSPRLANAWIRNMQDSAPVAFSTSVPEGLLNDLRQVIDRAEAQKLTDQGP